MGDDVVVDVRVVLSAGIVIVSPLSILISSDAVAFVVASRKSVIDAGNATGLLLLLVMLRIIGGSSGTRRPGCVFKQNEITEMHMKNTEMPATICKRCNVCDKFNEIK